MQHGSILRAASPFTPVLPGIRELAGVSIAPEELSYAVAEQFARQIGWMFQPQDRGADEARRIAELAADKYTQPSWNRKR